MPYHFRFVLATSFQKCTTSYDLVRPRRPELDAEMSVFNLAQKRSFPPLCNGMVLSFVTQFLVLRALRSDEL
jgi:hypothetical protein